MGGRGKREGKRRVFVIRCVGKRKGKKKRGLEAGEEGNRRLVLGLSESPHKEGEGTYRVFHPGEGEEGKRKVKDYRKEMRRG